MAAAGAAGTGRGVGVAGTGRATALGEDVGGDDDTSEVDGAAFLVGGGGAGRVA